MNFEENLNDSVPEFDREKHNRQGHNADSNVKIRRMSRPQELSASRNLSQFAQNAPYISMNTVTPGRAGENAHAIRGAIPKPR